MYFQVGHELCSRNGALGGRIVVERDGNRALICQQPYAMQYLNKWTDDPEQALRRGFAQWVDIDELIPDYGYLRGEPQKAFRYTDRKGVVIAAEQYNGQTQVATYTNGVFSGGMYPLAWQEGVRIVRSTQSSDLFIQMWLKVVKTRNDGIYPKHYRILTLKVLKTMVGYGALLRVKGTTNGKDRVDVMVLHSVPTVHKGDVIKVFGSYEGRRFVAEAVSTTRYGDGETVFHLYRGSHELTSEQRAALKLFKNVVRYEKELIYIPAGMD